MFSQKRLAPFSAVIAILFSLAMVVVSQQPPNRRSINESKPYKRWEWTYEQRAYPRKEIPEDALELGWRRLQLWRDLPQKNGSFRSQGLQPTPGRWVNIGPAPILNGQLADSAQRRPVSGRVSDIAVDPANPNRWLIGAAQGGVWETRDAGATWNPLTDNQPSLSIGAVARDPQNPQIIYAALGRNSGDANNGLYRSVNAGSNWTFIDGPWRTKAGGAGRIELALTPSNPKALYVSVQDASNNTANDNQLLGIWKTEDAWATPPVWVELPPLGSLMTEAQWFYDHELIVDPNNPNVLYVGGVHLWKCSDTSARPLVWEQLDNKPNNAIHVDQHAMAWTPPQAAPADWVWPPPLRYASVPTARSATNRLRVSIPRKTTPSPCQLTWDRKRIKSSCSCSGQAGVSAVRSQG